MNNPCGLSHPVLPELRAESDAELTRSASTSPTCQQASLGSLSGATGYFEDFAEGMRMQHSRGATVTDIENNQLSKQMMNTSHTHWNERALPQGRLVFGLVTASMVLGLASQDTASQALAEVKIDEFRFLAPVRQGATLTAYSEVVELCDDDENPDAGLATFRHFGVTDDGVLVFSGCRTLRLKRRRYYLDDSQLE